MTGPVNDPDSCSGDPASEGHGRDVTPLDFTFDEAEFAQIFDGSEKLKDHLGLTGEYTYEAVEMVDAIRDRLPGKLAAVMGEPEFLGSDAAGHEAVRITFFDRRAGAWLIPNPSILDEQEQLPGGSGGNKRITTATKTDLRGEADDNLFERIDFSVSVVIIQRDNGNHEFDVYVKYPGTEIPGSVEETLAGSFGGGYSVTSEPGPTAELVQLSRKMISCLP